MIRVLLADDQQLLVAALATIINAQPDLRVVATAGDGDAAIAAARTHAVDVAVVDIRMPRTDGIAVTRQLAPEIPVLILTTFNDPELIRAAIAAGAAGLLLKNTDTDVLVDALRTVASGGSVLCDPAAATVVAAYRDAIAARDDLPAATRQGLSLLTEREAAVLDRVARGETNTEIAAALFVAESTVKTHVSSLLRKLACRDRVALVVTAHAAGLPHAEEPASDPSRTTPGKA